VDAPKAIGILEFIRILMLLVYELTTATTTFVMKLLSDTGAHQELLQLHDAPFRTRHHFAERLQVRERNEWRELAQNERNFMPGFRKLKAKGNIQVKNRFLDT
jgi:hypothetical protein